MRKKNIYIYVIIVLFLVVGAYWYSNYSIPGEYDEFAKCLSERGVKMYGTNWCPHCKTQKEIFGKSFRHVDYVNCDYNMNKCLDAGVEGYPTWKINGENYPGVQTLERLSELSECEL